LQGGTPEENAVITRAVLNSEMGPRRDTVILNAAVSLLAAEKISDIAEGIAHAEECIDSGKASAKLNEFIEFTNDCADA
jgi:anthranilate phosphoribosyltransferase